VTQTRRILSLWFPRMAAEMQLRRLAAPLPVPLAVVGDRRGAQVLTSLSAGAEAAGLCPGQPLRDATAMCPALVTRPEDTGAEGAFLSALRRWVGKYSPWVAEEPPDALTVDLTGCAHLFGGEAQLLAEVEGDAARMGLTLRAGIADTVGAAWALARFSGAGAVAARSGDAIEQEARATRSRAARRRGAVPDAALAAPAGPVRTPQGTVAAPGMLRQALAGLPVGALRLSGDTVEGLARLGLRRVGDILGMPRAALARRFGTELLRRIDQALGTEPEPVSPARAPLHFAVRLTLPDPVGLRADVEAGLDRLLPALCDRLRAAGRGARRVRFEGWRTDGTVARIEVGLARPGDAPDAIRPLLALKLDTMEAGFGFDVLRLAAPLTEAVQARQMAGHAMATAEARRRGSGEAGVALADLIGRLGARLGTEAVLRLHPAESHIPEKAAMALMAAWADPAPAPWPAPAAPRPLVIFQPEPVEILDGPADAQMPMRFRWRRQDMAVARAAGPERIAPEWWLDDPAWRSGPRDYWRVETAAGDRLWLFQARGGAVPGGWFAQGVFA
jgi:protein ImuB